MYHTQDQTLYFTASALVPATDVIDTLALCGPAGGEVTRDALLLHLAALAWNKTFSSVEDLAVNGIWCQPLSVKKLWAQPAIASILAARPLANGPPPPAGRPPLAGQEARVIMEWITRNQTGPPTEQRDVDTVLWIYASLCRVRVIVWLPAPSQGQGLVGEGRVVRERARMTPKMPSGPSGLATFAAWDETATTVHLLQRSTIELQLLEPSRSEPICELRRYDNSTYTNIVIAPFVAQCPVVHTCSLALDQLTEGAYIYQVYLCRHEKRAWPSHIYQQASGLYVYWSAWPLRSPGPNPRGMSVPPCRWQFCAMVRLDSSTWPYFLIPYDKARCLCAIFASSAPEAEQLLEQWA